MRKLAGVAVVILGAALMSCRTASTSRTNCSTRSPAAFATIAPTLNTVANCNRLACPGNTSPSTVYTQGYSTGWLWQNACSTNFTIGLQDSILALGQQAATAHMPTCQLGKPYIGRLDYFTDFIVGGSGSCVVGVRVYYTCCGVPENPTAASNRTDYVEAMGT